MFCTQFRMLKNLIFGHFSRILDNRTKISKYASFGGVQIARNTSNHRDLRLKKVYLKSTLLANSTRKKGRF